MLCMEFRCLSGRYHATPWGHHVNEGLVEWPPSPWRLLRALLATWYRKAHDEIEVNTVRALVNKLASTLPHFELPQACIAHTRHYMPQGKGAPAKVFDTFLDLSKGAAIRCLWPEVQLFEGEHRALHLLLTRMGYLGRAECWIEAQIVDKEEARDWSANAFPQTSRGSVEQGEVVRLLTPMDPEEYLLWKQSTLEQKHALALELKRDKAVQKSKDPQKVKLTKRDRSKVESEVPEDLFDALHAETRILRKQGWSQPPGSRWVEYVRPRHSWGRGAALWSEPTPRATLPTVARFAVSREGAPSLLATLALTERVRKSLLKLSDGSPVFLGRSQEGTQLKGHQHVFLLAEANGLTGNVTHLTLFASMGFDEHARVALGRLCRVWSQEGRGVQLALLGVGQPKDFGGLQREAGHSLLLGKSKRWISRTPFVPTRHPKFFRSGKPKCDEAGLQIGSPKHDLLRLLREGGFPTPVRVESVSSTTLNQREEGWSHFLTQRQSGGGRRALHRGAGFVLEFAEPVEGPIVLGYSAHFGLGTFEALE